MIKQQYDNDRKRTSLSIIIANNNKRTKRKKTRIERANFLNEFKLHFATACIFLSVCSICPLNWLLTFVLVIFITLGYFHWLEQIFNPLTVVVTLSHAFF